MGANQAPPILKLSQMQAQTSQTIPPSRYIVQVTGACASFFDGHKPQRKTLFLEQIACGCLFTRMREAIDKAKEYCFGFQSFIPEATKFKVYEWSDERIAKLQSARKNFKIIRAKSNTLPTIIDLQNATIVDI